MLQRGRNAVRISSNILREWRRRTTYRVSTELSPSCRLISTSFLSHSLVATETTHSHAQGSSEEGQGADATAQSLENWNVDPLTGNKRVGSNWSYTTELSALAHRVGIDAVHLSSLQVALRDKSLLDRLPKSVGEQPQEHSRLAVFGRSVTLHYIHEYLYFNYPRLSGVMLKDISDFLNSDFIVRDLAGHLGISQLIQTGKVLNDPLNGYVITNSFYAVIGVLYESKGGKAARSFVHDFIISQLASKDLGELIKLQHPRFMLYAILKSKGKPRPASRLIKESGRATHFPSFVVGVYSGVELLGEGCGTSLKRAEREAMLAALRNHFQTEVSNAALPSDNEDFIPEDQLQWTVMDGQQKIKNDQSSGTT